MECQERWWTQPLAEDIYRCLREREGVLHAYLGQSPQITQRRYLVDWLAVIWEKYQLCATSRQLAVMLMDYFMDQFDIESRQLHLVALGSLLVATKFEEQETNIPRICDLNKHVPEPGFTSQEYLQMELLLLDFYKWNVSLPTAAHFTEYLLQFAQDKMDLLNGKPLEPSKRVRDHLQKYTAYFLEISMQDHFYRDFRPSHVAAACIVSSRVCLHITPGLGDLLEKTTMYSLNQLNPLIQAMLRTHHEDEMQSVPLTPPPTPKHDPPMMTTPTGMMATPTAMLTTPTSQLALPTYYIVTNPGYQLVTATPAGCSVVSNVLNLL